MLMMEHNAGTGHFFRILKLYNEIKKEHKTNIRYIFFLKI